MSVVSMTFGRPSGASAGLPALASRVARAFGSWLQDLESRLTASSEQMMTADQVMAWARRIETTDPGFAADLRGAAMRSTDPR